MTARANHGSCSDVAFPEKPSPERATLQGLPVSTDSQRGWRRWLLPPTFADEEQTERARIIYVMMLVTALVVVVAGGFGVARLSSRDLQAGLPAIAGYLALQLLGLWGIRKGWVRSVAYLYCGLTFSGLVIDEFVFGQHEVLLTASFINVTLIAGFSLGGRAALGFGTLTVLWVTTTVWLREMGLLPRPMWGSAPLDIAIAASGPLVVTAVLIAYGLQRLQKALHQARLAREDSEARARAGHAAGELGRRAIDLLDMDEYVAEVTDTIRRLLPECVAAVYGPSGNKLVRWKTPAEHLPEVIERTALDMASDEGTVLSRDQLSVLDLKDDAPFLGGKLYEIPGRRNRQGLLILLWTRGDGPNAAANTLLSTCAALIGAALQRSETDTQLRQAQKMEAVGQLAGGIAHDFNNLLTSIIGGAQLMLQDMDADDPNTELLRDISSAGEHASLLTRQLLVFSRKERLQLELLDLRQVVVGLENILRRLLGARITLQVEAVDEALVIRGDRRAIEQVLFNLCLNARDAIDGNGHITISLGQRQSSAGDRQALLSVSDDGCGMDAATQEHIFEPFFTTKGPSHGTGLGLSTVHGLVDEFGGRISCESHVGDGTRFDIVFPLIDVVVQQMERSRLALPAAKAGELVLLVEDHDLARRTLKATLESVGYSVITARDGHEALEVLERADKVAAVITDVVMPRMDGDQLVEAMRQRQLSIPTLMLSGYSARDQLRSERPRDVQIMAKPVASYQLLTRVRDCIDASVRAQSRQPARI